MADLPQININASQYDIVQSLGNRGLFPTMKDLLIFAAILGFSERKRVAFTSKVKDPIKGHLFENDKSDEIIYWIALSESQDPQILQPNREFECVRIFEEYACGGIEILQGWCILNPLLQSDKAILLELQRKGYFPVNEQDQVMDLNNVEF